MHSTPYTTRPVVALCPKDCGILEGSRLGVELIECTPQPDESTSDNMARERIFCRLKEASLAVTASVLYGLNHPYTVIEPAFNLIFTVATLTFAAVKTILGLTLRSPLTLLLLAIVYGSYCYYEDSSQSNFGQLASRGFQATSGDPICLLPQRQDGQSGLVGATNLFDQVLSQSPIPPIDQHTAYPVRDAVVRMYCMVEEHEENFVHGTHLKQLTLDARDHADDLVTLASNYNERIRLKRNLLAEDTCYACKANSGRRHQAHGCRKFYAA